MAYQAFLNIEGKEFDVVRCEFSILREADTKGRPSSNLYGGLVSVEIESTNDTIIYDFMADQFKANKGVITFRKDEVDIMKELKWENGYIIDMYEGVKNSGGRPMSIFFTVSAQTLIVEGVKLEQDWPETSKEESKSKGKENK